MRVARHSHPRPSRFGLLLAVLALLGQITFGLAAPAQAEPGLADLLASQFGSVLICHAGPSDTDDGRAPPGPAHHGTNCVLCPACHALATAAVLPASMALSPYRYALAASPARLPPARGPPTAAVLPATYPTGPPCLA